MLFEPKGKKRVELKPYKPRALRPIDYMTEAEFNSRSDGNYIVDTECYVNFWLCMFKCLDTGKVISFERSPVTMFNPMLLSRVMHERTTIGFNSINYDTPMIWLAHARQDLHELKMLSDHIIHGGGMGQYLQKDYGFIIHRTSHIDLMNVCPTSGSLKTYAGRLHAPHLTDLPFPHDQPLTYEQAQIVKHYCVDDLDDTAIVCKNLSEQLTLRYDLSMEYHTDVMSKSDPQVAEAIIGAEMKRATGAWPKRPKAVDIIKTHRFQPPPAIRFQTQQLKEVFNTVCNAQFEVLESGRVVPPKSVMSLKFAIGKSFYQMGIGGIHSREKTMAYRQTDTHVIKDTDVSSYYPKLILNQGIFPKQLGPEFINVFGTIVERRLEFKRQKNYAKSEGLKIGTNGTFGKTGDPWSILFAPEMMIQTTVTGQLSILMLVERFELAGISCISANTDGVTAYCPRGLLETMKGIVKQWECEMNFETEATDYVGYYARDVSNYLAFKPDGTVKGKGVYGNPWADPKLAIYRFHKNPNTTVCTRAVVELIARGVPIEQTIAACRDPREFVVVKNVPGGAHQNGEYVGKVVRWYYATGGYRTINKCDNNHLVQESEGAKPLMDLPSELPADVDYAYYQRKTTRMLEDIGFYRKVNFLL